MLSPAFEETDKVDEGHEEGKQGKANPEQADGEKVDDEDDGPE